jgi:hypothetical protein
VQRARLLGDRLDDRQVVDLLQGAGAPAVGGAPTTTIGDPLNWAWAIAETPLVTPGPAVSTARPGTRVSLPVASAANAAVCSWRTSSRRIGGSALTAPSYIGNTWAPDRVNLVSTPCARAAATASSPLCPDSCPPDWSAAPSAARPEGDVTAVSSLMERRLVHAG